MSDNSGIEWTDATWNPVTGCTKVSAGCKNCYAETLTRRFQHDGPFVPWTVRAQSQSTEPPVYLHSNRLMVPIHWKKPRMIFVNSMSDLFHPNVPDGFIYDVFLTMADARQHTFQVLTKRPERAAALLPQMREAIKEDANVPFGDQPWPLPNVWVGVSVENQKNTDRLDHLMKTPAAIRFVSAEPLLGPLDLSKWIADIGWLIVGGESGASARPMNPYWVKWLHATARAAGVPFFFKQWGEWCPVTIGKDPGHEAAPPDRKWMYERLLNPGGEHAGRPGHSKIHVFDLGDVVRKVGRKAAGAHLEGFLFREMPERKQI